MSDDLHGGAPRPPVKRSGRRAKRRVILLIVIVLLLLAGIALGLFWTHRPAPGPDLAQVAAPQGAQLLFFPIDHGLITAGYKNQSYEERKGYPHYGIDLTAAAGGRADILAAGDGVVLGTEFCDNSLGYITVIRHDSVFIPQTGETMTLIGRYYHMTTLLIREGETVTAGQVIGAIDRGHEWYNHIHLELDADVDYPFHTPQVAQTSSALLERYPATGEYIMEPIHILVVGDGQRISVSPTARSCTEKDRPRFAQL